MCQLLGMNCNTAATIGFSFTGFAERGGRTADHKDGWGLAFYEGQGSRVFHDDQPASDSALADFLRRYPFKSRIVIAHIRKATQGDVSLANCHPFQREWLGQTWFFATNGDLQQFQPALDGSYLPVGSTDSERAFCFMMQSLRARFSGRRHAPDWLELAPAVAEISAGIAAHGNFNFLLSNGQALFAHCSSQLHALQRQHPFPTARLVDYDLSLDLGALNHRDDRMALIATEPLTADEHWLAFRTGELKVFVDGTQAWSAVNEATRCFPVASTSGVGRGVRAPAAFGNT